MRNDEFSVFCKKNIDLKKDSTFAKFICKQIGLSGLGRTALNLENLTDENLIAIKNESELNTLIETGLISDLKPIATKLFVNLKSTREGIEKFLKFALCSNIDRG